MTPLTTLYQKNIDRRKLTEHKNPIEYIVPPSPPKCGSEQLVGPSGYLLTIVFFVF